MSPQTATLLTARREANTDPRASFYQQSPFQMNSNLSSPTMMPRSQQQNNIEDILTKSLLTHLKLVDENVQPDNPDFRNISNKKQNNSASSPTTGQNSDVQTKMKWPSAIPNTITTASRPNPRPYPPHLFPQPSML
ncbi:hypothetical protein VKT23_010716 [Stygiomarasmius scandens]|uniref:Uncharacterized protein n=1 Tax=Marasmiellus scandens TaxID=2682957 RepID=A0ABR1JB41_9AGAR